MLDDVHVHFSVCYNEVCNKELMVWLYTVFEVRYSRVVSVVDCRPRSGIRIPTQGGICFEISTSLVPRANSAINEYTDHTVLVGR